MLILQHASGIVVVIPLGIMLLPLNSDYPAKAVSIVLKHPKVFVVNTPKLKHLFVPQL